MVLLVDIVSALSASPQLLSDLHFVQLSTFFAVVHRLAPIITLVSGTRRRTAHLPPLPVDIAYSLSILTQLRLSQVEQLWAVLGGLTLRTSSSELLVEDSEVDAGLAALASAKDVG